MAVIILNYCLSICFQFSKKAYTTTIFKNGGQITTLPRNALIIADTVNFIC